MDYRFLNDITKYYQNQEKYLICSMYIKNQELFGIGKTGLPSNAYKPCSQVYTYLRSITYVTDLTSMFLQLRGISL